MHHVCILVQKYYADARRDLRVPHLLDIDSDCDKL